MCGLSGEMRFDGTRPDLAAVERMSDRLAARGPDGHGIWSRDAVALGHRRLKIIDLSERGAQPMTDDRQELTGVFNGCIYNYAELRAELRALGHRFRSTSDTEVVLKAYQQWGTACVDRFYGMFVFALVEHRTGRLILGRDRLGIKPLYLAQTPGRLRFASTLPALLAGGDVDTSLDPAAVHQYLSWHATVAAPRTLLAGVRKLAPATVRIVEPDGTYAGHLTRSTATGSRRTRAAPSTRVWAPPSGGTWCWTPCAPPCAGGWWPTCRSGSCSPEGWIPA